MSRSSLRQLPPASDLPPQLVTAASCLVSRVSPVQTAMRNCMRDEGRSLEAGNQVLISKLPQAAVVKSNGD
jgi:hypothetical protein